MKTYFPTVPVAEVAKTELDGSSGYRTLALVADENRRTASILAALLTRKGFAVMTAYSEREAFEIAELIPPDLFIGGLTMAGIKGLALAVAMKTAVPNCKILMIAGPEWPAELLDSPYLAGLKFMSVFKSVLAMDKTRQTFASNKLVLQGKPARPEREFFTEGAAEGSPSDDRGYLSLRTSIKSEFYGTEFFKAGA